MRAAFSRARNPLTCRSRRRPATNSSQTSKPPRRPASTCPREFITLLGGAAAAWPLAARAQQAERIRRVGVLMNGAESDPIYQAYVATFVQTPRRLGWREWQNFRIDLRWPTAD